ncbi:MAG: chorismate synthase [Gammaproteobacteria bacterium]|nr:chorismate synthase [Gammaproteobacteria bacterium]
MGSLSALLFEKILKIAVSKFLKSRACLQQRASSHKEDRSHNHGLCVLPRAVPIVDAMSALVIMDHYLRQKTPHDPIAC